MDYLIAFISRILTWVVSVIPWAATKLWDLLLSGLAAVLVAIPVPSWLSGASGNIAGMDNGIAWILQVCHIGFAFTSIMSALTIRFLIRRIPFIG